MQQSETELPAVIAQLYQKFGESAFVRQHTAEGMPTVWVDRDKILEVLKFLRDEASPRFEMLLDVTAIDERLRVHRDGQPDSDFTVVYQPISFSGNCDVRIKVALKEPDLNIPTAIGLWPAANWHERECLGHVWRGLYRASKPEPYLYTTNLGGTSATQGSPGPRYRNGPLSS